MTHGELIAAGFKFLAAKREQYDAIYQKRIIKENGIRYYINVTLWNHSQYVTGGVDGWQVEVAYNNNSAIDCVRIAADVTRATVADVERLADLAASFIERL